MVKPILNITIPVYNRYELTQLTIIHLNKINREIPFVITVVDNGSEERLRNKLIEFREENLIQNLFILENNYGISCACNIGFKSVDVPFYLKLDNDIVITDKDFIKKLFYLYNIVEPMSVLGPAYLKSMIENSKKVITTKYAKLASCDSNVPGGAMLIPKCVSDVIGYFSEDYGVYGADDGDYGLRLNQAGFHQYYYEYEPFFKICGEWGNSEYEGFDLDKKREHKKLFKTEDGMVGLFPLNAWLYDRLIRNWKVPLRYEIVKQDGYYLTLRERKDYAKIRQALIRSQKIVNYYLTFDKKFKKISDGFIPETVVERLKKIWIECGQACVIENMI